MVEVFCTSVNSLGKAEFLLEKLQREFPCYDINFDLEDRDNILRVESSNKAIDTKLIIRLAKAYDVNIHILPDRIPVKEY